MFIFSDEELIGVVPKSLDKIRPMLQSDGGDMELLGIKDHVVYIHLVGACHGCPSAAATLEFGVLRQLRDDIHQDIGLVNTTREAMMEIQGYVKP